MQRDLIYISLAFVFLFLSNVLSNVEPKDILEAKEGDLVEFSGVCGYSSGDFSIITNGKISIPVYTGLEVGRIYRIVGVYRNRGIKPRIVENGSLELETIRGAYWFDYAPSLLTPKRVYLKYPLANVSPGEIVEAKGVFFGSKFLVVSYRKLGRIREPRDGFPFEFSGRVVKGGNPAYVEWNKARIKVYLKDNQTLKTGVLVKILGISKVYGKKIIIYAYNVTVVSDEGTS
ncbi:hypothetical protein PNA2_0708 [Pyrococcus sp. NA2]|uniref:hypothetical protein n=1 Tax=Pyrococcus sp. (strain NA2) TaxID=342949 RepID=UPI000209ADD1|nr:hypothetical protein [Pyrococcus sp. NA2]AEC51624.1 hypothetical protein PNA2_0708 [Pyrococcus sp. NA2]